MVTNTPFINRVEKGVETSVYITEFAVIRILDHLPVRPVAPPLGVAFGLGRDWMRPAGPVVVWTAPCAGREASSVEVEGRSSLTVDGTPTGSVARHIGAQLYTLRICLVLSRKIKGSSFGFS